MYNELPIRQKLSNDGFVVIPCVLGDDVISELCREIQAFIAANPKEPQFGIRGIASKVRSVSAVSASSALLTLREQVLGDPGFLVRSTMFDKLAAANWKVAWHQDLTIATSEKGSVPGYSPWTMKDGVNSVQPPAGVLESMLTIRIHLDDCGIDNGPLRVLPGSHANGKLNKEEIDALTKNETGTLCTVPRGGALLMKPLLLHASSPSEILSRRRVIHLDFANTPLHGGLEWHANA